MKNKRSCRGILMVLVVLVAWLFGPVVAPASAQGCASDINGDGEVGAADLSQVLTDWGYCPGEVTSVTPLQGSSLGGTIITITGSGLSATTAVTVGGNACTNLQVLSPTLVKAVTPAGAVGEAAIAVVTAIVGFRVLSTPDSRARVQLPRQRQSGLHLPASNRSD